MFDGSEWVIEGHFEVPEELLGRLPHHEGFNLAFEDALEQLRRKAKGSWPEQRPRIKVEYAAGITTNPGSVGDYFCLISG
jgi:hypothetical protein